MERPRVRSEELPDFTAGHPGDSREVGDRDDGHETGRLEQRAHALGLVVAVLEEEQRGREEVSQRFASESSFCSSPDWYISFMMSQPPTNSPFT